jgi:hypothetical protein
MLPLPSLMIFLMNINVAFIFESLGVYDKVKRLTSLVVLFRVTNNRVTKLQIIKKF